jgi:hypothetical protein
MQSATLVAIVAFGCAALAAILAVGTGNSELTQHLINALLQTFNLATGAIIALIGVEKKSASR